MSRYYVWHSTCFHCMFYLIFPLCNLHKSRHVAHWAGCILNVNQHNYQHHRHNNNSNNNHSSDERRKKDNKWCSINNRNCCNTSNNKKASTRKETEAAIKTETEAAVTTTTTETVTTTRKTTLTETTTGKKSSAVRLGDGGGGGGNTSTSVLLFEEREGEGRGGQEEKLTKKERLTVQSKTEGGHGQSQVLLRSCVASRKNNWEHQPKIKELPHFACSGSAPLHFDTTPPHYFYISPPSTATTANRLGRKEEKETFLPGKRYLQGRHTGLGETPLQSEGHFGSPI